MSKLTISVAGLAIKDPNSTGLYVTFPNDDDIHHPHDLKMILTNFDGEKTKRYYLRSGCKISIDLSEELRACAPPRDADDLSSNIVSMEYLHKVSIPFKKPGDIQMKLSSVEVGSANLYSIRLTTRNYQFVREDNSDLIQDRRVTHEFGSDYAIQGSGKITIRIINDPRVSPNPIVLEAIEGKNYHIKFDNNCRDCENEEYNDFHLYYEVLREKGYGVILAPFPPEPITGEIIACNPVEGGGES